MNWKYFPVTTHSRTGCMDLNENHSVIPFSSFKRGIGEETLKKVMSAGLEDTERKWSSHRMDTSTGIKSALCAVQTLNCYTHIT